MHDSAPCWWWARWVGRRWRASRTRNVNVIRRNISCVDYLLIQPLGLASYWLGRAKTIQIAHLEQCLLFYRQVYPRLPKKYMIKIHQSRLYRVIG